MSANPAIVATIPKMLHLGADTEFHVAPGEMVLFGGPGRFAVVFPDDSPFNEHVFSDTHPRSEPVRALSGRFKYYWALAGLETANPVAPGIMISGVVAPVLSPVATGRTTMGGSGVIVVS